jgi:CPA1 family monovalent cation:H+ antiporter
MGIAQITLVLLAAVTVLCWLSARVRLPYPIVLVLAGLPIALIPSLPRIELHPEIVFLVFLPPLLYRAAATTDWGQFRRDIATISLLAVGLVLLTMLAVAAVAHWVIGLSWAVAFVLGAIVSPTDALAATVVMRRLRVPRRLAAIVEGESLVNDASALVAYRMAIAAVSVGSFHLWQAGVAFVVDSIGGVAIGCAVAWITMRLRRRVTDTTILQTGSLLVPFAAYIPAEELDLSGVLAVVACGLWIGLKGRHRAEAHIAVAPMWQAIEFILNGLGFILIGLQLPFVMEGLSSISRWTLLGWVVLIAATTIAARALWMFSALLLRVTTRTGRTLPRQTRVKNAVVLSWSGMRGIVSLAAALGVPLATLHGQPFPDRHLIICLTFGVILITLVGQGLTLPLVIRKLRLTERPEEDEEALARFAIAQAALDRIDALAKGGDFPAGIITAVHKRYSVIRHQLEHAIKEQDRYFESAQAGKYIAARRDVLGAMRQRLRELLDRELIDPELWTRLMWELDLEETTLSGFELPAVE